MLGSILIAKNSAALKGDTARACKTNVPTCTCTLKSHRSACIRYLVLDIKVFVLSLRLDA